MKTLNEYNKEKSKDYKGVSISGPNGIQCPECGSEMYNGDFRMLVATYPPKMKVYCKECGHIDYKVL